MKIVCCGCVVCVCGALFSSSFFEITAPTHSRGHSQHSPMRSFVLLLAYACTAPAHVRPTTTLYAPRAPLSSVIRTPTLIANGGWQQHEHYSGGLEDTGGANDVMFYFGDANTHAGKFVFQSDVQGSLKHAWTYPVAQVQAILNLDGQATMSLSDQGAMQITVDSGMGVYNYILPAQSK